MTTPARITLSPVRHDRLAVTAGPDPGGVVTVGPMARSVVRSVPLLTPRDIASLVETAARAPSVHNTQPWKFRARGATVELFAETSRMLRGADPAGRELMISCGAALFGLRLAVRRLGFVPKVELLPDPARPWLAARVEPVGFASLTRPETELLATIPHRHTYRGAFAPGEVPPRLLAALCVDAAAEGAELVLIRDDGELAALRALVREAAAEQPASAEVAAELRQWVLPAGSRRRDGVPASARTELGQQATEPGRLPQRDFGLPGTLQTGGGSTPPVTAVLTTAGDTACDWLRAGQALDRLLLRAATRWVFASLQSQPLEVPRCRAQVRAQLGLSGHPQMILQLGRANTAAPTARRPPAELMRD